MDRPVPASFWRGGTSRAVLFAASDLAGYDEAQVEGIILAALGSPDPDGRQVDGLGGGSSSLSKAAVVGAAPPDAAADVAFRFAQVEVGAPRVDFTGNCGNISAAIGPYAVEASLVAAGGDATEVVVLSQNTGQRFRARVSTRAGRYEPGGDFAIPGVPGTGSRIALEYLDAGGSIGRGVLPTGAPAEEVAVPGWGSLPVSIVDVGNPAVFVPAALLGAAATAPPTDIDGDAALLAGLEHVRREAAVRIGMAATPAEAAALPTIPKVAIVDGPRSYQATGGRQVDGADVDLVVRLISMGRTHRSVALTGAMACAAAAAIDGSVVAGLARSGPRGERTVRLGHPAGVTGLAITTEQTPDGEWRVPAVTVDRTAREIMRGSVLVPESYLAGSPWFAPPSSA